MDGDHRGARYAPGQDGFSLIEALVTLAILSIGLMGLAFLQAQGFQLTTSAYSRTQASFLTNDIIDRMRLNAGNAADYDSVAADATPADCTVHSAPAAQNDLDCWYGRLQQTLPGGDATIEVDGNDVTVSVSWRERPAGTQDDEADTSSISTVRQFAMNVEL